MGQMWRRAVIFAACALLAVLAGCASAPRGATGAPSAAGSFEAAFFDCSPAVLRSAVDAVAATDKDVHIVFHEVRHVIDAEGRVESRYRWVYKMLTQAGVDSWSGTDVPWSPWYQQRPEIRVRVTNPDGSQHMLAPSAVVESSVAPDSSLEYTDRRILRAPFPSVAVGSIVEEEVTVRDHQAFFAAGSVTTWYPRGARPVHHSRLVIEVPGSRPFSYRVALLPDLETHRTETGSVVRYEFEERDSPRADKPEEGLPFDRPGWPHVAFTTGSSWREVATAYASLVDEQLRGFVAPPALPEPVAGDAKATAVRYLRWINRRVRFTALALGDRSIVPTAPGQTLSRGFGDCKDKAVVLVGLLRAAGFDADVALLDSGGGRDVNPALPGLGQFDHAIVYLRGASAPWIDATDEYGGGRSLPGGDQGRLALIADAATDDLARIPLDPSTENGALEIREYRLASEGYPDVTETTEYRGSLDGLFRARLAHESDRELKENWEKDYIPRFYRLGKLSASSFSDPYDADKPFTVRLEIAGAGRGFTENAVASVAVLEPEILTWLPGELTDEKAAPRKEPYHFYRPLVARMSYRIVPPTGYEPQQPAADETVNLGTIVVRRTSAVAPDNTVTLTISLDTGPADISAEQFEQARKQILEYKKRDALVVTCDHSGAKLAAEGDYAKAIAAFRDLIGRDPRNPVHRTLLSETLLDAGLAEEAARVARQAADVDPKSAAAWAALGWVLEHDQAGRRFYPGYDRSGAIAAYRKAVELDDETWEHKGNLAILLEYDSEGYRRSARADLAGAIELYEKLAGTDGEERMRPNHLEDLFVAGRYAEVLRRLDTLASDEDTRLGYRVACVAAQSGAKAGMEAATAAGTPDKRRQALAKAGNLLMNRRLYAVSAALMREAARGSSSARQIETLVDFLSTAVPYQQIRATPTDPASIIRGYFAALIDSRGMDFAALRPLVTSAYYARAAKADEPGSFEQQYVEWRTAIADKEISPDALADIALNALAFKIEGDLQSGYHVTISGQFAGGTGFYLAPVGGRLLIAGGSDFESEIGSAIADLIADGKAQAARKWLDWVADDYSGLQAFATKGDRLGGLPFYRFWGADGRDGAMAEYAAAALMADGGQAERALPVLERGRKQNPSRSEDFDLALMRACFRLRRFGEAEQAAARLLAANPDSGRMAVALVEAQIAGGKQQAAVRAALDWVARHPGSSESARVLLRLEPFSYPSDTLDRVFAAAEKTGSLSASEYNSRAWLSLFSPSVREEDLRTGRTAVNMTSGGNGSILHTLAALYAEVGRCEEAKKALDEVMDLSKRLAPTGPEWFVVGRMAEQYGLLEAAERAYRRVHAPEYPDPQDTYWLAVKRLKAMGRAP